MLRVDFRRMFTMPLLYIMAGVCLAIPILILVMTTVMDGSVTVDPNTGVETTIEAFDSTWQIIGSASGESGAMDMSLTGMCSINLLYFLVAVLVCVFVSEDFRSGYVKNLFAVRAQKSDYVLAKTLAGFTGGVCMLFVGAMLGGAISGLPFDTGAAGAGGVVMCLLSKMLLVGVFVPVYLLLSVAAKQKLWLPLRGYAVFHHDTHAYAPGRGNSPCSPVPGRRSPVQRWPGSLQQSNSEPHQPGISASGPGTPGGAMEQANRKFTFLKQIRSILPTILR